MKPFLEDLRNDLIRISNKLEAAIRAETIKSENQKKDIEIEPSRNELILRTAIKELGVKEIQGSGNNARVVEYHKYASKSNKVEQNDSVPWCSSFICFVIEHCIPAFNNPDGEPMGSTNSMMARSWEKWGISTKKDPLPGDIVVFWRGKKSGWQGHVAILLRVNRDGSLVCLGGNQNDEVNITTFSPSRLLDIRRSSKARVYDGEEAAVLITIAHNIINGKILVGEGKLT